MDASSCVMGVERFVSRRGAPAIISSDNGINFVDAEKEIRENIEKWNTRPLTPVSADQSDLGAITPNHFLLGNQATAIPSIVGLDEFDHRKRYAHAQSYAKTIWSRWIKEYVPTLNRRSKRQTPAEQHLKTGDYVWIVEESNPRGYYG